MFGLEYPTAKAHLSNEAKPAFTNGSSLFLATARSAFALLCSFLRPQVVWLPSYLCGVVMSAFPPERVQLNFYAINQKLELAEDSWIAGVEPGDLVVFIDYFGFNNWSGAGRAVKNKGGIVVEDACQALLNREFCKYSDYVIFSPRKFAGVPDGGILLAQGNARLPVGDLPPAPAGWWLKSLTASLARAEFDKHGGARIWFDIFRETEAAGPVAPCRISELSTLLVRNVIQWPEIAAQRRENFKFLLSNLQEIAVFHELQEEVVPLGFPVRIKNRDSVRNTMFSAGIYPPVHWTLAGVVPKRFAASHKLAREIMTLPCDQRYSFVELRRVIEILRREGWA